MVSFKRIVEKKKEREQERLNKNLNTEAVHVPSTRDTSFQEEPLKEQVEFETQPARIESVSKQEQVVVQRDRETIQREKVMQAEMTLFHGDAVTNMSRWIKENAVKHPIDARNAADTTFCVLRNAYIKKALKEGQTDAAEKLMALLQELFDMPDYLDAKFRTQYVDTFPDLKIDIPSFEGYPYQEEALIRFIYERQELSEDGAKFAARKMIEDGAGLMPEDHAVYLEYERKEQANG